jgi:hypothetical protein
MAYPLVQGRRDHPGKEEHDGQDARSLVSFLTLPPQPYHAPQRAYLLVGSNTFKCSQTSKDEQHHTSRSCRSPTNGMDLLVMVRPLPRLNGRRVYLRVYVASSSGRR